ncbi:MAG: SDR family oxidoreductase [Rhodospirillaceae bacterium]|jgi:citronellol/citronellal dehydrogenase|nr:SDR family oxidoreductase [Rhodospirillaceae bacterium]MBT5896737.1 SDR family oxidoreductase [Rhodospirillaceae bacterium]MBT6426339.1 SDR family oxidoreductase [Rhodospirillaceae bacterium]MBT7758554.1 SDR family oxidoreductase [Rhodospirillaceae bacterium]
MPYKSVFTAALFGGQTIIVTGGGSGIGRCIAHELAHLGALVVITGRNEEKLEAVVAEIIEDGGRADHAVFDIREEDAVAANVSQILVKHGPISGLVNNAGGQFLAKLEDISQKGWETVVRTNLTGGFLVAREVLKQSMRDTGGSIVNITADHARSMPGLGHSGAARAGMENFTKTAALEWAHYGVRVNVVAPGYIATQGLQQYPLAHKKKIRNRKNFVPARRLSTEAEVSAAVVFLLSPAAAFISGETIGVNGAVPAMTAEYTLSPENEASKDDRYPIFDGFHRAAKIDFLSDDYEFEDED